jgi:hypothetical protein
MVTPISGAALADALAPHIKALTSHLRATYTAAFEPAHAAAVTAGNRFEKADGTRLDPTYAADIIACRAVTAALPTAMSRHLPGTRLHHRPVNDAAVVDSTWRHPTGALLRVEWDYIHPFGNPEGLIVREVGR